MMNIKRIRFDEFGPYRDWSFTTGDNGVQLMYGPNESGKTSLLEGMRTLLFGGTHKAYGPMTGPLMWTVMVKAIISVVRVSS